MASPVSYSIPSPQWCQKWDNALSSLDWNSTSKNFKASGKRDRAQRKTMIRRKKVWRGLAAEPAWENPTTKLAQCEAAQTLSTAHIKAHSPRTHTSPEGLTEDFSPLDWKCPSSDNKQTHCSHFHCFSFASLSLSGFSVIEPRCTISVDKPRPAVSISSAFLDVHLKVL
ncbi:hypothetical protein SRHO_G00016890 [Serrasalmus rhombeus]